MSFTQVAFVANLASVLGEAFHPVSFVVQQLHVALVKNSSAELHVTNITDVSLLHVRLNVTGSS